MKEHVDGWQKSVYKEQGVVDRSWVAESDNPHEARGLQYHVAVREEDCWDDYELNPWIAALAACPLPIPSLHFESELDSIQEPIIQAFSK